SPRSPPLCRSSLTQHTPCSTLFPYTTLFRSTRARGDDAEFIRPRLSPRAQGRANDRGPCRNRRHRGDAHQRGDDAAPTGSRQNRSEEHTSELQSRENPVCRLLLEKKNRQSPG